MIRRHLTTLRLVHMLGDAVFAWLVFLVVSRVPWELRSGSSPSSSRWSGAVLWAVGLYRIGVRWSLIQRGTRPRKGDRAHAHAVDALPDASGQETKHARMMPLHLAPSAGPRATSGAHAVVCLDRWDSLRACSPHLEPRSWVPAHSA